MKLPKTNDEKNEFVRQWFRGKVLKIKNFRGLGREFRSEHRWILISRDDINWNARLLIIAIPVVSLRDNTLRTASDLEVKKEDSPTGRAILVKCGQVHSLDRFVREIIPVPKELCSPKLLSLIDEKLIEVFGLDEKWALKTP